MRKTIYKGLSQGTRRPEGNNKMKKQGKYRGGKISKGFDIADISPIKHLRGSRLQTMPFTTTSTQTPQKMKNRARPRTAQRSGRRVPSRYAVKARNHRVQKTWSRTPCVICGKVGHVLYDCNVARKNRARCRKKPRHPVLRRVPRPKSAPHARLRRHSESLKKSKLLAFAVAKSVHQAAVWREETLRTSEMLERSRKALARKSMRNYYVSINYDS